MIVYFYQCVCVYHFLHICHFFFFSHFFGLFSPILIVWCIFHASCANFNPLMIHTYTHQEAITGNAIFGGFHRCTIRVSRRYRYHYHHCFAAADGNGADTLYYWGFDWMARVLNSPHLTWTNRYNSTGLIDAHLFTHEINKREATPEQTSTQRTETAPPFKLVFICWVRARKRVYRSLFLFRMCVYVCLRIVPFGLSSFIFSSIEILFVSFGCCCCLFEFWVAHHTFWAHWNENERVKRVVHICVPEGTCTHIGIQF